MKYNEFLKFIISYWSQIAVVMAGLAFIIKQASPWWVKKKELNHLEKVMQAKQFFQGSYKLFNSSITLRNIYLGRSDSSKLDETHFRLENACESLSVSSEMMKLYFGGGVGFLLDQFVNQMEEVALALSFLKDSGGDKEEGLESFNIEYKRLGFIYSQILDEVKKDI